MRPTRFLSIAGTDPSGGAGQSADIKTASALGAYAASVLTAVLAQNTCGVRSVMALPQHLIRAQLDAVFEDIVIDCVKIGMVSDLATAQLIREFIERYQPAHVVLDPVMVAKSGDMLVDRDGFHAVRDVLIPIADVITPNLPEAAVLLDADIPASHEAMEAMLPALGALGSDIVVLKGGYLTGDASNDLVLTPDGTHWLQAPRVKTHALHGSGCTLASAIAALLPRHDTAIAAIEQAKGYMTRALEAAERLEVGKGQGPAHHFHTWW